MFLLDNQQKYILVYSIIIILVGLLFVAAIILFIIRLVRIHKKGKLAEMNADSEIKESLYKAFGGKENLVCANCDMSRVTVEVKNIELVDGDILKQLGASGVLLVGNKVKCSFNEQAQNIHKLLEEINN